jgi:uncharacterized protein (DUF433 family)
MTETISYEAAYIVKTPGIVGGKARVNGSRIPVWTLVAHYLNGASPEALANDFEISLAQVHGGLAYYYEHREEIDPLIREDETLFQKTADKRLLVDRTLLTAEEAAHRLGVSHQSRLIARLCREGTLKARKIANRWFIEGDSLEEYARRREADDC